MTDEKLNEIIFEVLCRGRTDDGMKWLKEPVKVEVRFYQNLGSDIISSDVSNCPYNTGGHGDMCKASVFDGAICPYAVDLPRSLDVK